MPQRIVFLLETPFEEYYGTGTYFHVFMRTNFFVKLEPGMFISAIIITQLCLYMELKL